MAAQIYRDFGPIFWFNYPETVDWLDNYDIKINKAWSKETTSLERNAACFKSVFQRKPHLLQTWSHLSHSKLALGVASVSAFQVPPPWKPVHNNERPNPRGLQLQSPSNIHTCCTTVTVPACSCVLSCFSTESQSKCACGSCGKVSAFFCTAQKNASV